MCFPLFFSLTRSSCEALKSMAGFSIHASNRMEVLAGRLAEVVVQPGRRLFSPECIAVPSAGMRQWLSFELSRRLGIWGNATYDYPPSLFRRFFRLAFPELPARDPYEVLPMTWGLFSLLSSRLHLPEFAPVRRYLDEDRQGIRRWQLAHRLASLFDRYLVYRQDLLLGWENSPEAAEHPWQARLWCDLAAGTGTAHNARLVPDFIRSIRESRLPLEQLPLRIHFFGVAQLAPVYMDLLTALAGYVDIHFFTLNPCREFWGEILSRREQAKVKRRASRTDFRELHLEEGNPLLASMGGSAREFQQRLLELEGGPDDTFEFTDPGRGCLLHSVQSDLLSLRGRGEPPSPDPVPGEDHARQNRRLPGDGKEDLSLQVHACHGPMREMEVLYDRLLDLLERLPDLEPRNILVMMPDPARYAPYIDAVFGTSSSSSRDSHIPYTIADRGSRHSGGLVEAFLQVLDLAGSRWEATGVMDLLASAAIRRRFGLSAEDAAMATRWVRESGIRWGLDGDHRRRFGYPAYGQNTWRSGMDRWLLGMAMPSGEEFLFRGILPTGGMEGDGSRVLGAFLGFLEALFERLQALESPRPAAEWARVLMALLRGLFLPAEDEQEEFLGLVRQIESLESTGAPLGMDDPVALAVIRPFMEESIASRGHAAGFLTGGTVFCSLRPMRGVPFEVVALVGMNYGDFPPVPRRLPFNRMDKHPRPGDPMPREEERLLFLEALLSARRCLYISYTGQDQRDNHRIPPSVVVEELLDYLDQFYPAAENGAPLSTSLRRFHPSQPFSRRYFQEDRFPGFFSYSEEIAEAFRQADRLRSGSRPYVLAPVRIGEESMLPERIRLRDLKQFYRHPAQYFFNRVLGVRLGEEEEELEDREPFDLDSLENYSLKQDLVRAILSGAEQASVFRLWQAQGRIPPGRQGEAVFEKTAQECQAFSRKVQKLARGAALPDIHAQLAAGPLQIAGELKSLFAEQQLAWRCTRLKAKDLLGSWLDHLFLLAAGGEGYPRRTLLVMEDRQFRFEPLPDPVGHLRKLAEIQALGLGKPLPFFPETSLAFVTALRSGKSPADAVGAARKEWARSIPEGSGEGQDAYLQRAFGPIDPLGEEWQRLSCDILEPMLNCRQEAG